MNKSVTEDLTQEEYSRMVQKDQEFLIAYMDIADTKSLLTSSVSKAPWVKLTYKQYLDFHKKAFSETAENSRDEKIEKEWESKYGGYEAEVDSLCRHYRKVLDGQNRSSYVSIELVNIQKTYEISQWTKELALTDLQFVLKITPLKGPVDEMEAYFGVAPVGEKPFFTYYATTGRNMIDIKESFSSPLVLTYHPFLTYDAEIDIKKDDSQTLPEKYSFETVVSRVTAGGKEINVYNETDGIPGAILYALDNEGKKMADYEREYSIKNVVEDVIGKEYESKSNYEYNREKEMLMEIDELAASFYYYAIEND